MMNQRELIYNYNKTHTPEFNHSLFTRSDDDIIESLRKVIYSIQRNSTFKIIVENFEVITDYDEIQHILWTYYDSKINKSKYTEEALAEAANNDEDNKEEPKPAPKKKSYSSSSKKTINMAEFIDLKDSDIYIIKVSYYIAANEIKNGYVDERFDTFIAVPRIVDDFYFRIKGNLYYPMYQVVDASTYNDTTCKNKKKHSITFKTAFTPIRVYRYQKNVLDYNGHNISCTYFNTRVFNKTVLALKYILARYGFYGSMEFLHIESMNIVQSVDMIDKDSNYIFPVRDLFITINKYIFTNNQVAQSLVYTLKQIIDASKVISYGDILDDATYIRALGSDFVSNSEPELLYDKGVSVLESFVSSYDQITKEDLKLDEENKADTYRVLRWMMYEFSALRRKSNVDITTKKIVYGNYIAFIYASKLALGVYRISDNGNKITLKLIKKNLNIQPMYLLNEITKSEAVSYDNLVNDMDAIIALKHTCKGTAGIGTKSNSIPDEYRMVHPSHLGRFDIDSSSNSDPGVSGGTICPYVQLYDKHFSEYEEPCTWQDAMASLMDKYKSTNNRVEMCRIINDNGLSNKPMDVNAVAECAAMNASLFNTAKYMKESVENQPVYIDLLGDGLMIYTEE